MKYPKIANSIPYMSQLYQSVNKPIPGLDFTHPTSAIQLKQSLSTVEFVAQKSNKAVAVISLKPDKILYTCPTYSQL